MSREKKNKIKAQKIHECKFDVYGFCIICNNYKWDRKLNSKRERG
jgi:hypothetical protein